VVIGDSYDRSKYPLCDEGRVSSIGQGQNMFLYLWCQAQQPQDLCYPGAGDALLAGDIGLSGDLARIQEGFPFDGFSEEFDDSGGFGDSCRFARRGRPYHSVGRRS